MNQQTITIAGHSVPLAYCYGTEISFADLAGQDINEFFPTVIESINNNRMPAIKPVIDLILAAALAASEAEGKKCEIVDSDLMYQATPEEMGLALGTVIGLRAKFYHLSKAEADQAEAEAAKKGNTPGNA